MAELADAPDLGSGGRPCRFESCCPHHSFLSRSYFPGYFLEAVFEAFGFCLFLCVLRGVRNFVQTIASINISARNLSDRFLKQIIVYVQGYIGSKKDRSKTFSEMTGKETGNFKKQVLQIFI